MTRKRDDEEWVLSCGAKDHEGWQRHPGALLTWRRRLRGHRKVIIRRRSDDTPEIIKRSRMGLSDLNRRVIPADYHYPYPDGYYLSKFRGEPMVLGRGTRWLHGGGPVGWQYRQVEAQP